MPPSHASRPKPPIRTQIREYFRVWGELCTPYRWPILISSLLLTLGLACG